MKKAQDNSIQARFGFDDQDLKSTDHDKIMLWLDSCAELIIQKIIAWDAKWPATFVEKRHTCLTSAIARQIDELKARSTATNLTNLPSKDADSDSQKLKFLSEIQPLGCPPPPKLNVSKTWEYVLSKQNYKSKSEVGFIDMLVTVTKSDLKIAYLRYESGQQRYYFEVERRLQPVWQTNFINDEFLQFGFEVKTKIPSLGELIRQLRIYKQYCDFPFYVVSPERAHRDTLNEQGFGFISFPEGEIYKPRNP